MKVDKTNTPDEVIDLVNEQDEIIGTTTKGVANNDPKIIHREIAVVIYDDRKRVLFQQRSKKKLVDPLVWSMSCEGHIPAGISPEEGAKREVKEELDIDIPLRFIEKKLLTYPNESHFVYCFIGKYNNEYITIEPEEIEQVRFLSETDMREMMNDDVEFGTHTINMVQRFWNGEFDTLE